MVIGEHEENGKRSKELKVILKPEYQALVDENGYARHFNNAIFSQAALGRSKRHMMRLLESISK